MKKLLFLTIAIFIQALFHPIVFAQKHTHKKKQIPTSKISLNGVDETVALSMINYFRINNKYDKAPLPTSVHFTRSEILTMVNLLHKEIKADKPGRKDSIDGIRIYFASDTNGTINGHLQNTAILVSTRARSDIKKPHMDYYDHDKTTLIKIRGLKSNDHCGEGAKLYTICTGCLDDKKCDWTLPHYYKRSEAEQIVQNFGKDTINTISEWFDLKMFDQMMKYDFDGLRIYFGRHIRDQNTKISNRDSFVITTTKYDSSISNYKDYFDCITTNSFTNYSWTSNPETSMVPIPSEDKGELCPYNCN